MPKVTLARNIKIRNHPDLRIINIHDRKLRNIALRSQLRVVERPHRFIDRAVGERLGVGIEVCDEGDEPVFHVGGDGGVLDICSGQVLTFISYLLRNEVA